MGSLILYVIVILILVDVFLAYEIPTHVAYVLATIFIIIALDYNKFHAVFIGILIWFGFLLFHYLIWRKLIEKIHDVIISPQKHTGGIEGLVGKNGTIIEVNGTLFICINEELYEFINESNKEIVTEKHYEILRTLSNKLII